MPDAPVKVLNLFAYTGGCDAGGSKSGCKSHACGCFQRHGDLGKRKCKIFRVVGCADPMAGRWTASNLLKGKYDAGIIMMVSLWILLLTGRGPKGEIWKIEEKIYPFYKAVYADHVRGSVVFSY